MTDSVEWSEENSELYRQLAAVAVPAREEQIATLLSLLPFGRRESFRAVELASGEGRLAYALLQTFPNASLLALDGEDSMRSETARRLKEFGARVEVGAFDMVAPDWYPRIEGVDVILSSLCVHHLTGAEKQTLFTAVCSRLSERGAFLIADLVLPQRSEGWKLFAETWDRSAEAQSIEKTGSTEAADSFVREQWNYYRYPDPFDKPSPLYDQLTWLNRAGFAVVDCFWMQAGHAIYGGYKRSEGQSPFEPLSYRDALASAQAALR